MNKKKLIFANILIILFLTFTVSYASSAKAEILVDTSGIISNKQVNLELKLSNLDGIDTSKPIAVSGFIDYDKTIFSDIEIQGSANGMNVQLTKTTYEFLADGNSIPSDGIIAKFTILVSDNIKVIDNSPIKINSITIAAFNEEGEGVKLDDLNLTGYVSLNNGESSSDKDSNSNAGQDNINETNDNISDENNNQTINETNNNQPENNVDNSHSVENSNQSEEPNNDQSLNKNEVLNNNLNLVEDLTTTKDEKLPQTGVKYTLILFIFFILIVSLIVFIKYKKFYD